jgi:hypothetical protein
MVAWSKPAGEKQAGVEISESDRRTLRLPRYVTLSFDPITPRVTL